MAFLSQGMGDLLKSGLVGESAKAARRAAWDGLRKRAQAGAEDWQIARDLDINLGELTAHRARLEEEFGPIR